MLSLVAARCDQDTVHLSQSPPHPYKHHIQTLQPDFSVLVSMLIYSCFESGQVSVSVISWSSCDPGSSCPHCHRTCDSELDCLQHWSAELLQSNQNRLFVWQSRDQDWQTARPQRGDKRTQYSKTVLPRQTLIALLLIGDCYRKRCVICHNKNHVTTKLYQYNIITYFPWWYGG